MRRHWQSRAVEVALPMAVARAMWGRAWRVDTHVCERLGTRRATMLLCAEEVGSPTCTPIGWCSMRWHPPDDAEPAIDHLAWDDANGVTEADAWRAIEALAGRREFGPAPRPDGRRPRMAETARPVHPARLAG